MTGVIGNAPIYVNGLLSLLFVFVLPGLACASFLRIGEFPQRWFAIFLISLVANHLLVTLIAAFHLDPLLTYRVTACVVLIVPVAVAIVRRYRLGPPAASGQAATLYASDLGWLAASTVALAVTYFNLWKYGVPNIFRGGDVLVSWNDWALIWSQGNFPTSALGYPQFIPTLWAVTYIFTGSPEQYFAFYIYVGLIMFPILLNAMILGRISWWHPLVPGLAFVWLIAEIRMPWLRATLQEGFPDWVAAIFASCGVVLFAVSAPKDRFGWDKVVNALLALCLVSLAAATKPMYGLLALAVLAGICTDACQNLAAAERNRFLLAATGLLLVITALYAIYFAHITARGMPYFPADSLQERLSLAVNLFNSNFTIPFRIIFVLGLLLCPFVKRLRWFALPLYVAVGIWANTAAYDLRNLLGFVLVGIFVPFYAGASRWLDPKPVPNGRQWRVRDGIVAATLAVATFVLTSTLAMADRDLKRRFADDQLRIDAGFEQNQKVGEVLRRGCKVFSATGSILHIVAFAPFRSQVQTFFYSLPLQDSFSLALERSAGCTAVFYPPTRTHPSNLSFIADYGRTRGGWKKVIEGNGMELLVTER